MKTEVYLVIQKRADGALPDPVKVMYTVGRQGLQFTKEDAERACIAVNEDLGGEFAGVFRCILKVVEEMR